LDTQLWNEILDEFRALGGVADNVRLDDGPLGRGVFVIDPALPARLHVSENMLVSVSDIVFENGALRISPKAGIGERERRFVEDYYGRLSWGAGGRGEIERVFEHAQKLPENLRYRLSTEHRCSNWFVKPTEEVIQQRFLQSRHIDYEGRTVLMPMTDLVNHGAAPPFLCKNGITIAGKWESEVFVHYGDTDPYGAFESWGFTCEEPTAFSIEVLGNIGPTRLHIERALGETKSGPRQWVPRFSNRDGDGVLNFLMLGNRQYPRLCKGIFYKTMQSAGLAGYEEAFDTIQHVNRMHFLALLETLEKFDGPMVQTLRRMARYQLQALSYCFGVRMI